MNQEVEHVLEQSHTVRQLIEVLQGLDQDARILFTCNYGDYHRTQQALPITEVEEYQSTDLTDSGYSQSGIAFTGDQDAEPDEPREDDDDDETVVIFHSE